MAEGPAPGRSLGRGIGHAGVSRERLPGTTKNDGCFLVSGGEQAEWLPAWDWLGERGSRGLRSAEPLFALWSVEATKPGMGGMLRPSKLPEGVDMQAHLAAGLGELAQSVVSMCGASGKSQFMEVDNCCADQWQAARQSQNP